MDIMTLVKLTSKAWSLSILAQLDRGVAGRQAELIAATGAGRTAFSQSLDHLLELGLVERNPGHGHPLRPEFRLSAHGREPATIANRVYSVDMPPEQKQLLRRHWSLPVLVASRKPRYFGEIKSRLCPITDRALSQSIKLLETHDWLHREIDGSARPPRAMYQAANKGAEVTHALRA